MTITVLSAPPQASAALASAGTASTEGGSSVDFAALLGQQLTPGSNLAAALANLLSGQQAATTTQTTSTNDLATALSAAGLMPQTSTASGLGTEKASLLSDDKKDDSQDSDTLRTEDGSQLLAGLFTPQLQAQTTITAPDSQSIPTTANQSNEALALTGKLGGGENLPANLAAENTEAPADFAALVSAQKQAAQKSQSATPSAHHVTQTSVNTHLSDPAWSNDFGDKVVWMARNNQQTVQININPQQLGPVQITLSINGDQVSANFVSPHAEVRQAMEDSLPKLREMLSGAGINLGDANIGAQQQNAQREQFAQGQRSTGDAVPFGSETAILPANTDGGTGGTAALRMQSGSGLVNLYA